MSLSARDWSERYAKGDTPWDQGDAHPELVRCLAEGVLAPAADVRRRVLVPGCGRGHDALALAGAGWSVTAVDVVDALSGELDPNLRALGGRFLAEDALGHQGGELYDLLWEHTFFCTIDPEHRGAYGELARRAVAVGGRLAALVFPVGKPRADGGPPWGISVEDLVACLGDDFTLLESGPVEVGFQERRWGEELALFERR